MTKRIIITIITIAVLPQLAFAYPTCPAGEKFAKLITNQADPYYGADCSIPGRYSNWSPASRPVS